MKKLSEYLSDEPKFFHHKTHLRKDLSDANEYFSCIGGVPEYIEELMLNGSDDFVLESLKSHPLEDLVKQIEKKFHGTYLSMRPENENLFISFESASDKKKFISKEEFNDVLNFFNYFVSESDGTTIMVEPKFSERIVPGNFLLHFAKIDQFGKFDTVESILRNGLRCRGNYGVEERIPTNQKDNIREFPRRIYMLNFDNGGPNQVDLTSGKILELCKELYGNRSIKLAVFCIDGYRLSKADIPIYTDTAMCTEGCVFTYANIPPESIKLLAVVEISHGKVISVERQETHSRTEPNQK